MIETLDIKNFRLFEHLRIEGLKRVNLFAGKNNSGKTALLEALRIMAAKEDASVLQYIMQRRGIDTNNYFDLYDSIFYRPAFEKHQKAKDIPLVMSINGFSLTRTYLGERQIRFDFSSDGENLNNHVINIQLPSPLLPRDKVFFVPFNATEYFPLQYFWDQIALTPQEDKVTEILQNTILPDLVRLDVQQNERVMVRLKNQLKPLPMKNLGDGTQRMFLIALALVSAKDNMLLIDEVETGLHYSVLEKMWEIIFTYAEELNVQVFATTHSLDALKTFTYVLEKTENQGKGVFFRLQPARKTGQIEAVPYGIDELELSLESNLDPR